MFATNFLVTQYSIVLQSDIGFGKLETYVKLGKLGEVRCFLQAKMKNVKQQEESNVFITRFPRGDYSEYESC